MNWGRRVSQHLFQTGRRGNPDSRVLVLILWTEKVAAEQGREHSRCHGELRIALTESWAWGLIRSHRQLSARLAFGSSLQKGSAQDSEDVHQ